VVSLTLTEHPHLASAIGLTTAVRQYVSPPMPASVVNFLFFYSPLCTTIRRKYWYRMMTQRVLVRPFVVHISISTDSSLSAAKGKFIRDKGLKGFAMWHSAGDSNDILLTSISGALGIEGC